MNTHTLPKDNDATRFADAIGRREIAEAVGVGPTAVSNAVVRGWFPATWFLILQGLAEKHGVDCPPQIFKMKQGVAE